MPSVVFNTRKCLLNSHTVCSQHIDNIMCLTTLSVVVIAVKKDIPQRTVFIGMINKKHLRQVGCRIPFPDNFRFQKTCSCEAPAGTCTPLITHRKMINNGFYPERPSAIAGKYRAAKNYKG